MQKTPFYLVNSSLGLGGANAPLPTPWLRYCLLPFGIAEVEVLGFGQLHEDKKQLIGNQKTAELASRLTSLMYLF